MLKKLFQIYSELSEPMIFGTNQIIIYRGLKLCRKTENGDFKITVEDTSFENYSPIKNKMVIKLLIEHGIRQKEACGAEKDCSEVGG